MAALRVGASVALTGALTILLAACTAAPRRATGVPPVAPVTGGAAEVPDAVPRIEPRSVHGNPPFYDVNGRRYQVLARADGFVERGVASWYGPDFHGHSTSTGERYDMYAMTAAHRTLPIPCYARITNLANGRSVVVRINDRGPFVANRIVDLSYSAALRLDIVRTGTAFVELRTVGPESDAPERPQTAAAAGGVPAVGAAAAAAMTPATPATPPVALYIQVGAYADLANAERVIARLQKSGLSHVFSLAGTGPSHSLRRVRIGPIATVEEFDRLAARLAGLGYPEARLAND